MSSELTPQRHASILRDYARNCPAYEDGGPGIEESLCEGADALDLVATQRAEIARLRQECADLRGAMAADDERLRAAERRVWGGGLTYGCDGPEHLADEIARLRTALEAARAFVARLDECQPHIDNAFLLAHVHGSRYSGPNYADELKELRAALTSEGR